MDIGNQFTRVFSLFDSILIYTEEDTRRYTFTFILSLLVFKLMVRTSRKVKIGKYKDIVV